MGRRATSIEFEDRTALIMGDPMLDSSEGTLVIVFDDGSARIFNWDFIVSYYHLSEEETVEELRKPRKVMNDNS